jgi:hypothetical protein
MSSFVVYAIVFFSVAAVFIMANLQSKSKRHRILSLLRPQVKPDTERELGMEALDLDLVDNVNRKNNALAAKTGKHSGSRSWTKVHANLPRFKNSGEK